MEKLTLDPKRQEAAIRKVAEAARKLGLIIAPIGSAYFSFKGEAKLMTKDVDAAVHDADLEPASLDEVVKLGKALGESEIAKDQATVTIKMELEGIIEEVDLIRGKSDTSKGYVPRELLRAAARKAELQGNLLLYPPEYVLALKADAAIDREFRSRKVNISMS